MKNNITENEYKENFFKILSRETLSIEEQEYKMYLEETHLYSAIVYKDKKSDDLVKKFISTKQNISNTINDNYLLPIGSVVRLYNEEFMIVARVMKDNDTLFDYTAVKYPLGLVDDEITKFNFDAIDEIMHFGYESEANSILTIEIKNYLDRK